MKWMSCLCVSVSLVIGTSGGDALASIRAPSPMDQETWNSLVIGAFVGGGVFLPVGPLGQLALFAAGTLVVAVDPEPATYLRGTSVIVFPDDLLRFEGLTWYGPFADDTNGDVDPGPEAMNPVQGSGFSDVVDISVRQRPAPDLEVNEVSVENGVLTVSWNAPNGIGTEADPVNIFGAIFSNISSNLLHFSIVPPIAANADDADDANLYQDASEQDLVCMPSSDEPPQRCGYPEEAIGFSVEPVSVPEPTSSALLLSGLLALFAVYRSSKAHR
jgi:hypothetical protein